MLNQTVLVGRLTKNPEIVETESGKKVSNITIAVPRTFKNSDGIYETDFIEITLWNSIAERTVEYCKKGDLVGIKGRIQSDSYEKDGEKKSVSRVIAEKLTFLAAKTREEPEPSI